MLFLKKKKEDKKLETTKCLQFSSLRRFTDSLNDQQINISS